MARLCIRIAPNNHPTDPSLDVMRTQLGDVVCIVDDGHIFSSAELNSGQYRIVDVPGVSQEELIYLCAHVDDAEGKMIRRRAVTLDADALRAGAWRTRTTATKTQIAAITVTRA